ncbi:MAG: 5'-nucleotidase C-terminal domain-containing protein [Leucobacter sp.]
MRFKTTTAGAIALVAGLVLAGSAPVAASAVPRATEQAESGEKDITFIVTQDFHGRIDQNTVQWAGTVEERRAAAGEDHSIFLSAGDNFGNSLYASSVQGEKPTVDVLNALDLEATAIGNAETFIGYDKFLDLAHNRAEFPHLSANMVDPATMEPEFDPYVIREVDGVRIGVIGVTTPDTQVQFPDGDPLFTPQIEALNNTAEGIVERDEADIIVALVHDGGGLNSPPATLEDELNAGGVLTNIITQASPHIDALFTAHTHNRYVYDAPVPGDPTRTRPVIQAGAFGTMLGEVTLSYDPETSEVTASTATTVNRTTTPVSELVASYPRVAEVKTIVDQALAYADEQGNQPAGQVTQAITTAASGGSFVDGHYTGGATGNRTLESALGTLVGNMFRDVQQDQEAPPQFGITIPNFIRSDLTPDSAGNIPVMKIIETFGIRDSVVSADITGAQLKRLFEQQWQRTPQGEAKGYIQLAMSDNLTYTYDDTRDEGDRITSITLDGEPIDLSDTATAYRVGLSGALLIGIVNFHVGTELTNTTDSGMLDVDGFMRYFRELSETAPVAPDFMKHGAKITGLEAGAEASTGDTVEFDVSNLNLTSLGAPEVTSLDVRVGGQVVATAPVTEGAAHVSVTVPVAASAAAAGASRIELTTANGSVVRVPIKVSQASPPGAVVTKPTVTGSAVVGKTVQAKLGAWRSDYSVSYQWQLGGKSIKGATKSSYKIKPADAGKKLSVRVTAKRSGQDHQTVTSKSVRVTKASSKLTLQGKAGAKGKATVTVKLALPGTAGSATSAKVKVYDGKKLVKSSVAVKKGKATVKLTKLKSGKHTIRVSYAGSKAYKGTSKTVKVTVK